MIKLLKVKAPTTLKLEGEVTSLSGADKREVKSILNHCMKLTVIILLFEAS
jgi:hypothetical protein